MPRKYVGSAPDRVSLRIPTSCRLTQHDHAGVVTSGGWLSRLGHNLLRAHDCGELVAALDVEFAVGA
jgi:hypothetical protein